MPYLIVIVLSLTLDRVSKWYIDSHMTVGDSVDVINGFFAITYVRNDGIAFGMLGGKVSILVILTALLIIAIAVYLFRKRTTLHPLAAYGIAAVIGGGAGNLIDRISAGYVIDFLDFKVWPPVFNVADIFVCVGCGMVIVWLLFIESKKHENDNS